MSSSRPSNVDWPSCKEPLTSYGSPTTKPLYKLSSLCALATLLPSISRQLYCHLNHLVRVMLGEAATFNVPRRHPHHMLVPLEKILVILYPG